MKRFLFKLFTPDEARLALHLSYKPTPAGRIVGNALQEFNPGQTLGPPGEHGVQRNAEGHSHRPHPLIRASPGRLIHASLLRETLAEEWRAIASELCEQT